MKASKKTKRGVIGATVLAGVLAVGGFALTNTNTVTAQQGGEGSGDVTAIVTNSSHYELLASDPTKIEKVHFTLAGALAAGATAYVSADDGVTKNWSPICVDSGDHTTFDCTYTAGYPVVSAVTKLDVVAID